jgi:nucleoside-diphosphate-sugar epimerase
VRVLVAGDRGCIGAVLVPFLRAVGHEIDGLDPGLYERCDVGPVEDIGARLPHDIRDARVGQLAGYDSVICVAPLPLPGDEIARGSPMTGVSRLASNYAFDEQTPNTSRLGQIDSPLLRTGKDAVA